MAQKPKVLRILNRFNLGGPVYNATYLTKYLENDFETLLVGGEHLEEEENAQFIPESLGLKPLVIKELKRTVGFIHEIRAYYKIRAIISVFKPDIVHTHASKAGFIGRLAASHAGVKHIVHTYHGHVFEHYFGAFRNKLIIRTERYLARKSEAIIAISRKQKTDLTEKFKIAPENKVTVIPLGFDLNRFQTGNELKRKSFRSDYQINEDEIAVGIIGRLAPVKNHRLFINTLSEIRKTNKKVKVVIIGDGNLKSDLMHLAGENGLMVSGPDAGIIFTSWIKEIDKALPGLDIVCLTSFSEGTPVSLIEAQAAGRPVISTDVGGVRDIIGPDAGFIFKLNETEKFSAMLSELINDRQKRENMGKAGKEFVFENFTSERLVQDVKNLYLNLLNY